MSGTQIFGLSFLDGFTFGGFFSPARLPGAPNTVFAATDDSASTAALANKALDAKNNSAELAARKFQRDRFDVLQGRSGENEGTRTGRRAVKR